MKVAGVAQIKPAARPRSIVIVHDSRKSSPVAGSMARASPAAEAAVTRPSAPRGWPPLARLAVGSHGADRRRPDAPTYRTVRRHETGGGETPVDQFYQVAALASHPGLATELFHLFNAARSQYLPRLRSGAADDAGYGSPPVAS